MITKCTHCNKKFKAKDDWRGKSTKCPICHQIFYIEEYVGKSSRAEDTDSTTKRAMEKCTKCGRAIGRLEQAYVFNGELTCHDCDMLLQGEQTQAGTDHEEKEKLNQMTKIANFLVLKKGTKAGAIGSIIFGIIGFLVGLAMLEENPINAILILIGVFLLIEGIAVLISPKPGGLVLQAIGMWMVGLWNLGITLLELAAGIGWSFWGFLGLAQLVWGCQIIARYNKFSEAVEAASDKRLVNEVEEYLKDVLKAKAKSRDDIVAFQMGGIAWKGHLGQSYGMFTKQNGEDTKFLLRDDVSFTEKGKVLVGKSRKVKFRLGAEEMDGTIPPEDMERLEAWKKIES